MLKELGNAQKQRIGGLAQLTVRVKPSQKARKARNPATNKESTIAAKPASPHASADEGHGRAAKRAESPPTTGRANGLTQPWALINGVSFRQLPEHAMVSDDADPAAVPTGAAYGCLRKSVLDFWKLWAHHLQRSTSPPSSAPRVRPHIPPGPGRSHFRRVSGGSASS